MRPAEIAKKNDESAHQKAFFAFCNIAAMWGISDALKWAFDDMGLPKFEAKHPILPALLWAHHIPNGGARGDSAKSAIIRGGQLKAEGVKPGILDVCWPFKTRNYIGMYMEFKDPEKKPKTPRNETWGMTKEQIEFAKYVYGQGWFVCAVYSWVEAVNKLLEFLEWGK